MKVSFGWNPTPLWYQRKFWRALGSRRWRLWLHCVGALCWSLCLLGEGGISKGLWGRTCRLPGQGGCRLWLSWCDHCRLLLPLLKTLLCTLHPLIFGTLTSVKCSPGTMFISLAAVQSLCFRRIVFVALFVTLSGNMNVFFHSLPVSSKASSSFSGATPDITSVSRIPVFCSLLLITFRAQCAVTLLTGRACYCCGGHSHVIADCGILLHFFLFFDLTGQWGPIVSSKSSSFVN